ncbi:MAG TPA: SAM-dependent methyltransferase [Ignavibacteria bacterium]|nr:SAM-dependent methyltransferase [Ignavibacteria bacterium]
MEFVIKDIGRVSNERKERIDDNWSEIESEIILNDDIPLHSLHGLSEFSHIEVFFYFHKVPDESSKRFEKIPRELKNLKPKGIFSQRAGGRPNKIGNTICKLISVEGRKIRVENLDAINDSPVIDIKPVYSVFLPKFTDVTEPDWVNEITKNYW